MCIMNIAAVQIKILKKNFSGIYILAELMPFLVR